MIDPTLQALHAQLDGDPKDWTLRHALADRYEELTDLARAAYYRWSAGYQFRPASIRPEWWIMCQTVLSSPPIPCDVPDYIFNWIALQSRRGSTNTLRFPSRYEAEEAVRQACEAVGYPSPVVAPPA